MNRVIEGKTILLNTFTNCTFIASALDEEVQTGSRANDKHIEWAGELDIKVIVLDKLPDGVLWEKAKEYSKQFTSFEKPVQSAIEMNAAQDHYYRGMIALRDMIEKPNDEAINLLDGLVSDVGNLLCDVADLDFEWQQAGYYETAKKWLLENKFLKQ